LSVGFPVAQRPFFELDYRDQKLFAIVCGDDFSVTVELSKASGP
jgi:hypothetical protein